MSQDGDAVARLSKLKEKKKKIEALRLVRQSMNASATQAHDNSEVRSRHMSHLILIDQHTECDG
jgi:hypothetical protein